MQDTLLIAVPFSEGLHCLIQDALHTSLKLEKSTEKFFILGANMGFSNLKNTHEVLKSLLYPNQIDYLITSKTPKKLILCDMDMTLVACETLDLIAQKAGIMEQVSKITQMAMNGEINFIDAIIERVALLKGFPLSAFDEIISRIILMQGCEELAATVQKNKITGVIVSGGFTHFSYHLRDMLNFKSAYSNEFEISNNKLTGKILGKILDDKMKLHILQNYTTKMSLSNDSTVAVGDGSNDILMLKEAGLGVAFQAKPIVRNQIDNQINFNGLEVLSWALQV